MEPRHESKKFSDKSGYICYARGAWHSEVGPGSVSSGNGLVKYWLGDVEILAIYPPDP